jgi:hypothetical protein
MKFKKLKYDAAHIIANKYEERLGKRAANMPLKVILRINLMAIKH